MIDLQGGKALIFPRPGARIAPSAMFDALKAAGFRGDAVTVEATGEVKRVSGRPELFLPGSTEAWLALPADAPADGPARIRLRILPGGQSELLTGS
ncbi:MAG: hypothetical protein FD180_39 [Planctomycetota bacterium]|nr:MAG: hypothetical protein FD180_39 [Planctomycetota bacterium]